MIFGASANWSDSAAELLGQSVAPVEHKDLGHVDSPRWPRNVQDCGAALSALTGPFTLSPETPGVSPARRGIIGREAEIDVGK